MAALLRRHVCKCRSRQLYEALIFPPPNHSACGASHFKTVSHFLNQCSSDSAIRAQKASGASDASRRSASNSSRDFTCARAVNSGGGGNTRSSWSTDSMLVVAEDITLLVLSEDLWRCGCLVYQNPPRAASPTRPAAQGVRPCPPP